LDLAGAAGAALAGSIGAMFLGAAVLSFGGRRAMDRLLPWFQVIFQFSYLIFMGGHAATRLLSATAAPRWLAWSLPSFWFLAPFEAWMEGWSWGAIARTLLAAGTLALLLAGGVRFLGAHVGERLLAPVERSRSRSSRSARRRGRRRLAALFPGEENRRLFELLLIHLRSDWRTRSEFLSMPVVALFLIFQFSFSSTAPAIGPTVSIGFLGWFLVLSLDVLTRSSRPSSLWCILVSPVDRVRLSLATVLVVRLLQLLPIALLLLGLELARAGPSLPAFLTAIEFFLFGDLLILMGRGLFPDFPFSRPSRMEGEAGGRRALVAFSGALVSGVGVLLLWLARQGGISGEGIAILLLLLLRVPTTFWMRRRVTHAAETLELAMGSAD
ncbi:MAG TPA: hypothetical protein VK780_11670, partial [Thermoanaerobaculia bacterium]|nr:hypothetical protein [Thermoanaerobaculia bacterium]